MCCHTATKRRICSRCLSTLRPAPDRLLPGGLRLVASWEHYGGARRLMHLLKYQGVTQVAQLAASVLADRLPELPLVPIPRALSRRIKYGVDPALALASEVSARTGQPVIRALRAPIHTPRRAGGDHHRPVASFHVREQLRTPVVIIDDVATTGGTILAAVRAIGQERVALAAAANAANKVTSLPDATRQMR